MYPILSFPNVTSFVINICIKIGNKSFINVIRSIILLLVNYLEVSLDFAILYYLYAGCKVGFGEMIGYSVLDMTVVSQYMETSMIKILDYAKAGSQFFFMTMAFGYFANHLHQREFRS